MAGMLWVLLIGGFIVSARVNKTFGYYLTCPIADKSVSHHPRGDEKALVLRVYQCSDALALMCNAIPQQQVEIKRGVPTALNFSTSQGWLLKAGYFGGLKNCYAWYASTVKSTIHPPQISRNSVCKSACQDAFKTTYINYEAYTTCDENNTCATKMSGVKIDVIPKSGYNGKPGSCIVYGNGANDFDVKADSVTVNITRCSKADANATQVCGDDASEFTIPTRSDAVTNLKNDVNGHQVLARFMGADLCVALRERNNNNNETKCLETCFKTTEKDSVTYLPYERDNDCISSGSNKCVQYDSKSFRIRTIGVEVRNSGSSNQATKPILLLCFLIFVTVKLLAV